MVVACLVLSGIFFLVALAFFMQIAPNWIQQYRTMPEQEKRKIRIGPLSRNVGFIFLLASIIFAAAGISPYFKEVFFRWVMIGWMILTGFDVYFIGKSKRYKTQ